MYFAPHLGARSLERDLAFSGIDALNTLRSLSASANIHIIIRLFPWPRKSRMYAYTPADRPLFSRRETQGPGVHMYLCDDH